MSLHDAESCAALLEPLRQLAAPGRVGGQVFEYEPRCCDVRLVAVLLEEHPLQYLGTRHRRCRKERRAVTEVPEDSIRLGETGAIVELERRNAAVRIPGEEAGGTCFAGHDV